MTTKNGQCLSSQYTYKTTATLHNREGSGQVMKAVLIDFCEKKSNWEANNKFKGRYLMRYDECTPCFFCSHFIRLLYVP